MISTEHIRQLASQARGCIHTKQALPFAVYSSTMEQRILNSPITKPLLIFVLSGAKQLGSEGKITCPTGGFIFLSNGPAIDMRNIPANEEYLALLIDFEYSDFDQLKRSSNPRKYLQGEIDYLLAKTLQQYMEWAPFAYPQA